jgi:23S rRNA pseudoU1915 N3-methylase RlmH
LLAVSSAASSVRSSAQDDPLTGTVAREVRDARRDGKSEIFIMVTGDEGFADQPSADDFLRGTTIFIGGVTGLPEPAVTNEAIYTWQSARVGEVLPPRTHGA